MRSAEFIPRVFQSEQLADKFRAPAPCYGISTARNNPVPFVAGMDTLAPIGGIKFVTIGFQLTGLLEMPDVEAAGPTLFCAEFVHKSCFSVGLLNTTGDLFKLQAFRGESYAT